MAARAAHRGPGAPQATGGTCPAQPLQLQPRRPLTMSEQSALPKPSKHWHAPSEQMPLPEQKPRSAQSVAGPCIWLPRHTPQHSMGATGRYMPAAGGARQRRCSSLRPTRHACGSKAGTRRPAAHPRASGARRQSPTAGAASAARRNPCPERGRSHTCASRGAQQRRATPVDGERPSAAASARLGANGRLTRPSQAHQTAWQAPGGPPGELPHVAAAEQHRGRAALCLGSRVVGILVEGADPLGVGEARHKARAGALALRGQGGEGAPVGSWRRRAAGAGGPLAPAGRWLRACGALVRLAMAWALSSSWAGRAGSGQMLLPRRCCAARCCCPGAAAPAPPTCRAL